jgi:hypothetical protein
MNNNDIVCMVSEVGAQVTLEGDTVKSYEFSPKQLAVFAELVAVAEREACAQEVSERAAWSSFGRYLAKCVRTRDEPYEP